MFYSSPAIATFALLLHGVSTQAARCTIPATLDAQLNIWKDHVLHPTSLYRRQVEEAAAAIMDEELKEQASRVAGIGTFTWMESTEDIQALSAVADEVPCSEILGIVLDNLPYKDAVLNNPEDEYDPSTEDAYQTLLLKPLAEAIKASPTTAFAVIVEPDAFAQFFNATTTSTPSAHETNLIRSYRANIPSALAALNLANVIMYLDIGHSNSLDWSRHRNATADAIAAIYDAAGSPSQVRGFATNVANWNAWSLAPGEFAQADDSQDIRPSNEQTLVRLLSTSLRAREVPSFAIFDTSRNGVSGLRASWDEWCNVNGAGLGARPGAAADEDGALDAYVWAKRPGESDGVSSEHGGDAVGCAALSAVRPAPERDVWFQGYFEMLVRNAEPEL
ncbi:glycoside hydrolase family 6 protein [Nemania sp. FL0916]|nr:glycoside hydrolase family 6 protein [Nemania sp. FL0916]